MTTIGHSGVSVSGRTIRPYNPTPAQRTAALGDQMIAQVQMGIDPLVAAIAEYNQQRSTLLGDVLFADVPAPNVNFQYPRFADTHLVPVNARRAIGAQFGQIRGNWETVAGVCHRYGLESVLERDEIANATAANGVSGVGFDVVGFHTSLAFEAVRLSREVDRSVLALAAGTYVAGHDVTLGAGDEWDNQTNGDPRGDVRSLGKLIAGKFGRQLTDIRLITTTDSRDALEDSPDIKERLSNRGGANLRLSDQDLADYIGIGQVITLDSVQKADEDPDTAVTSLYDDVAFVQLIPQPTDVISQGSLAHHSFVRFSWLGEGRPENPYYTPWDTSWHYPWEAWENPGLVNANAVGIIRNCAA